MNGAQEDQQRLRHKQKQLNDCKDGDRANNVKGEQQEELSSKKPNKDIQTKQHDVNLK